MVSRAKLYDSIARESLFLSALARDIASFKYSVSDEGTFLQSLRYCSAFYPGHAAVTTAASDMLERARRGLRDLQATIGSMENYFSRVLATLNMRATFWIAVAAVLAGLGSLTVGVVALLKMHP
jgi:hypothetical protein